MASSYEFGNTPPQGAQPLGSIALSQAVRLPMRGGSYPVRPRQKPPTELPHSDKARSARLATGYLSQLLPNIRPHVLSHSGSRGLVLQDGEHAYKFMRSQPYDYANVENEAAKLTVLSREDIAPQFFALIDAAMPYRNGYHQSYMFGGRERIPRIASDGHFPILVTKFLPSLGGAEDIPKDKVGREFMRILEPLVKHRLYPDDCPVFYDYKAKRAVLIDVGDMIHTSQRDISSAEYSGLRGDSLTKALIAQKLAEWFTRSFVPNDEIAEAVRKGDAGLQQLVRDRFAH